MKTKIVKPCGVLFVGEREYNLLYPTPLSTDGLPQGGWVRFLVCPNVYVNNYERHIITTEPWTIEYRDMEEIVIETLEDDPDFEIEEMEADYD